MSQIEYFPTIYMKGLSETMYSIGGKYRGIYLNCMGAKSMNNDMHNQKLCNHLNELIDIELDKTNPDMNLIEECNALLDILEGGEYDPQLVDENQALNKLYKKYRKIIKNQKVSKIPPQTRSTWKKIPVVACICLLLIVLPITVGAVVGLSPAELLEQLGSRIFSWDIGSAQEIEGMTFIRNGEAKHYESVEQCLSQENLKIDEPTWLPEGVKIEAIVMLSGAEYDRIIYELNTDDITISINLTDQTDDFQNLDYDSKAIDETRILHYAFDRNRYRALLDTEGMVYVLTAGDIQTIENIVNGLQGDN